LGAVEAMQWARNLQCIKKTKRIKLTNLEEKETKTKTKKTKYRYKGKKVCGYIYIMYISIFQIK